LDTLSKQLRTKELVGLVLMSASGAQRLAELHAVSTIDSVRTQSTRLMPKELAITISDYTSSALNGRVSNIALGADMSLEVLTIMDGPSKYAEAVADIKITTIDSPLFSSTDLSEAIPAPFAIFARPTIPNIRNSTSLLVGAVDSGLLSTESTKLSISSTDALYPSLKLSSSLRPILGKLEEVPPLLQSSVYTTHSNHFFSARFKNDSDALEAIKFSISGDNPSYSPKSRLFLVGEEFIQVLSGVISSIDTRVVIFTGLLRGRKLSDARYNHKKGELVIVMNDNIAEINIPEDKQTPSAVCIASIPGFRQDRKTFPLLKTNQLVPSKVGHCRISWDFTVAHYFPNGSAAYTMNSWNVSTQENLDALLFSNTLIDERKTTQPIYNLYLLNGVYDKINFESELTNLASSYIFQRMTKRTSKPTSNGQDKNKRNIIADTTLSANNIIMNPLTLVVISTNKFGESRTVIDVSGYPNKTIDYKTTNTTITNTRGLIMWN
jgi:hypothetical protein